MNPNISNVVNTTTGVKANPLFAMQSSLASTSTVDANIFSNEELELLKNGYLLSEGSKVGDKSREFSSTKKGFILSWIENSKGIFNMHLSFNVSTITYRDSSVLSKKKVIMIGDNGVTYSNSLFTAPEAGIMREEHKAWVSMYVEELAYKAFMDLFTVVNTAPNNAEYKYAYLPSEEYLGYVVEYMDSVLKDRVLSLIQSNTEGLPPLRGGQKKSISSKSYDWLCENISFRTKEEGSDFSNVFYTIRNMVTPTSKTATGYFSFKPEVLKSRLSLNTLLSEYVIAADTYDTLKHILSNVYDSHRSLDMLTSFTSSAEYSLMDYAHQQRYNDAISEITASITANTNSVIE